jgi:epoxyqueuosine reductase
VSTALKQAIQGEARRLGFTLAGVTTPDPPPHLPVFARWIAEGRYGDMAYLADERAAARRSDPRLILPGCRSILVLGIPYSDPSRAPGAEAGEPSGRVAAYAWGDDYHLVLPDRLKALVAFIETQLGRSIPNRWYTDTGPLLERELAQRAGLGWIGKNTCLINPQAGSYFLLAEILLGIDLPPDDPFETDQCGSCTRCLQACPTQCILPDRTIEARRCISYLTIELRGQMPPDLRPQLDGWVFGCDVCQMVCPWNRFAAPEGDAAFTPRPGTALPVLAREMELTPGEFSRKFRNSAVKRTKRHGYLRNVAVALGNQGDDRSIPVLENAQAHAEGVVADHARWAIAEIERRRKVPGRRA